MRILFLLLCLAVCGPVHAQQTGAIRGWVGDPVARSLPGVTVTVKKDRADAAAATTLTNAAGAFSVERLAPGPYEVTIAHVGFPVATMRVYVAADATARVATLLSVGDLGKSSVVPTIRGTVLDPDGKSFEGAFVRAVPIAPLRQLREDGVVTSDARGRFELPAGVYEVFLFIAIAPGHLGTVVSQPDPTGAQRGPVEIRLKALDQR